MLLIQTQLGPSSISGIGLFTLHPIPKDSCIYIFDPSFDRQYTEAEIKALPDAVLTYLYPLLWRSKGTKNWNFSVDNGRFFNHSDTPNVSFASKALVGVTLRLIKVDEELTCDYNDFDDIDLSEGNLFDWIRQRTGFQDPFDKHWIK